MNTFDELNISTKGMRLTIAIKHLIEAAVHEANDLTYNDLVNIERMFTRGMVNSVALAKGKCSTHKPE